MAWEGALLDDFEFSNNDTTTREQVALKSDNAASNVINKAATFNDLVSLDLVLICITSYLTVPSLLSLSATNKRIRSAMHNTLGSWRIIDFSEGWWSRTDLDEFLFKFFGRVHVREDCRVLILDGLIFDHFVLDQILKKLPLVHSISLRSCPNLNGEQIIKLIEYIRRPSAPRPLSVRRIFLLGAPLFPLDQPSLYAPIIVSVAGSEIETDLHSLQCYGKIHIDNDVSEQKWHLKIKDPNHPCTICEIPQDVCKICHDRKSCRRCQSFYCDKCEPFPQVITALCFQADCRN
jgi:hypothetical protein